MKIFVITLLFTTLISGCANMPEQISLVPDVNVEQYDYSSELRVSLETVDQRVNQYLISIRKHEEEVTQLIVSGSNVRQQIQQELSNGFSQQKLNQVDLSPTAIKVTLLNCQADITQNSFSYEGSSSVQLKVTVSTPKGNIAKLFKSEQKFEEAFSIDIAKIQRNLNDQLSRAIERILADPEIRKNINGSLELNK